VENKIKIKDFVKLTGTTLKTVIYYHKIGLLKEPMRSSGGYRLYGPEELNRMRSIKRLKSLGFNLKNIKELLGESSNKSSLRDVLNSLRRELQVEKENLEERLTKIDNLLKTETISLDEDILGQASFKKITETIGIDQTEVYEQKCPELFEQQKKIHNTLGDFEWGENYKATYEALAQYFKDNPEKYQKSLELGVRLNELLKLSQDNSEIEILALDSANFIKSIPKLKEILCNNSGLGYPFKSLYNKMSENVLSPVEIKFNQLLQQFLND
jgi:DNA-binding transcriptional MerR regulator